MDAEAVTERGFEIELAGRVELAAGIHDVAHPKKGKGFRIGLRSRRVVGEDVPGVIDTNHAARLQEADLRLRLASIGGGRLFAIGKGELMLGEDRGANGFE